MVINKNETTKKKKERQKETQRLEDLAKSSSEARWQRDKLGSTDRSIMDAGRTKKK